MSFWCRIRRSNIKLLSPQLSRGCCISLSAPINQFSTPIILAPPRHSDLHILKGPNRLCETVRFFAGFAQRRLKEEPDGHLLNDQITAPRVRLVTDEGHYIVSRQEALERARKLALDLVEVQKRADPPVCKLMDYNKERYKKEVAEKERFKSKGELTLRRGEGKEVRFTRKIENKDLKMKADTAIRLMERGYRVKCMAVKENGKEQEDVDLGALLSRFIPLIDEVAVLESGPRVEKKQAYVVVRHIKFGLSKKGGMKKLSDIDVANPLSQGGSKKSEPSDIKPSKDLSDRVDNKTEVEDEFTQECVPSPKKTWEHETTQSISASRKNITKGFSLGHNSFGAASNVSDNRVPTRSSGVENRYLRKELVNESSPHRPIGNRSPGVQSKLHAPNEYLNQTKHENDLSRTVSQPYLKPDQHHSHQTPNNQSRPGGFPSTPTSGYGIFSSRES